MTMHKTTINPFLIAVRVLEVRSFAKIAKIIHLQNIADQKKSKIYAKWLPPAGVRRTPIVNPRASNRPASGRPEDADL